MYPHWKSWLQEMEQILTKVIEYSFNDFCIYNKHIDLPLYW